MNDIETSRVFSETAEAFAKGFRYIINKGGKQDDQKERTTKSRARK